MNKGIVFLGTIGALGLGWASATWLDAGPAPAPGRISDTPGSISWRPAAAPAVQAPDVAKPADVVKPEPAKPAPKVEPPKPAISARVRKVSDVRLTVVKNGVDYAVKTPVEVHVDLENTMTWFGEEGKTQVYKDWKHLGDHLRQKTDTSLVIVAAPEVPWQQIRLMLLTAQDNYAPNASLAVAAEAAPDQIRLLPIPQCQRSDEPLPEGTTFSVTLTSKEGANVALSVDGRKIEKFPEDLAAAWSDWKKAHADLADTSVPEKTRVVFEAPKGAAIGHVLQVLDVFRGIGIQSERIAGAAPMRKLK